MNICVICYLYPTADGKGGYFFVEQLVNEFVKQGHRLTIISPVNLASKIGLKRPYGPRIENRVLEEGAEYQVYRPRYYGRDIKINGVSWARYECRKSIERIIKRKGLQFDAIYCHFYESGALAYPYARKHHVPLFIASGESRIPELVKSTKAFSIEDFRSYVSGVICVSTKNKEESVGLGYTVEEKCLMAPNGVDLQIFQPLDRAVCRKELYYRESDFIVACIGNFSERKGQKRIIEAVKKLGENNIRIILGGTGEIAEKSKVFLHCGFIAHDQIPKYLSASDVYVIPTRREGCCNSIIEAMACGLPIISSDRQFNWDVLNKDNSILVDPDNVDEIADAIQTLYDDSDLRDRMGKNALSSAQDLSIKRRAERIVEFMKDRMNYEDE